MLLKNQKKKHVYAKEVECECGKKYDIVGNNSVDG